MGFPLPVHDRDLRVENLGAHLRGQIRADKERDGPRVLDRSILAWMVTCGLSKLSSTLSGKCQEGSSGSGGGRTDEEKNHPWRVYPTRPAGTGILRVGNF